MERVNEALLFTPVTPQSRPRLTTPGNCGLQSGLLRVVAASDGVDEALLHAALLSNPAGNADQQTPLVLLRPGACA